MTREAFIRKWLANKDFQYCEDGRAQMREDLDKVIDHAQQKLKIDSVSGKRPFECPNCHATLQEVEMTNREIIDALAACASGAVDKTVSVGCVCGSHDTVTRRMIRQCADCGRPI